MMMFLFMRFIPMVTIFEMKDLLHKKPKDDHTVYKNGKSKLIDKELELSMIERMHAHPSLRPRLSPFSASFAPLEHTATS